MSDAFVSVSQIFCSASLLHPPLPPRFAPKLVFVIERIPFKRHAEATGSDADYWIPQKKRLLRVEHRQLKDELKVRLAQRILVRIKLVDVPNGTILSSGMTATVRIEPKHESEKEDHLVFSESRAERP